MNVKDVIRHEPFGTLLGYAPGGVAIYSSDYSSIDKEDYAANDSFRSYIGNEYMGHKWQCVEFARRFLYLHYGAVFTDVGMAYEIFSLRFLRKTIDDDILPLQAFENGSKQPPAVGALLIWHEGGEFKVTGHVAVITEVLEDKVRIAEQNVIHTKLPMGQQWTRELPLKVTDNGYFIQDTFDNTTLLGWMIQTEPNVYSLPQPKIMPELLNIHAAKLDNKGQFDGKWLDESSPLEKAYVLAQHGHIINQNSYEYFTISESAEQELIRASNEMHLMYLHATEKVLKDDNLLRLFDIPEVLWPRIRLSWQNRRHQMITGRLDFCMDERGVKVYEYNADSASCHTEAGLIIEKWAQKGGIKEGFNPGERLLDALADAWKHCDAKPFVHILQDDDSEEDYHALFMQQSLTQAGYHSKILRGLDELHWNSRGQLIDADKRIVECVWKTWAWETALEQLREESEQQALIPIRTGHPEGEVRLVDVLLRPEITVFEPLWTLIPSNKAILPILWQLFPDNPYLLDTDFTVTPRLEQSGYAIKPIAGRCGSNIGLVDHKENVLDETYGQFDHQENIYQELWCLPKVANRYIQVCTFTVGGHYGGCCLRSDPTLVIKKESDIEPLIVIEDKHFLAK
ncbi:bifunctional glutathionylspermidine amidase/synthase [Proteus penneri]|uniref:bifunctional glutathionylspermidine amidase/synthase n=1 Tax=Proteus penneri TaxID=102862 RepID=UPI0034D6C8C6